MIEFIVSLMTLSLVALVILSFVFSPWYMGVATLLVAIPHIWLNLFAIL